MHLLRRDNYSVRNAVEMTRNLCPEIIDSTRAVLAGLCLQCFSLWKKVYFRGRLVATKVDLTTAAEAPEIMNADAALKGRSSTNAALRESPLPTN
jgi:hypothetical protein